VDYYHRLTKQKLLAHEEEKLRTQERCVTNAISTAIAGHALHHVVKRLALLTLLRPKL
jgi:hypothetical protein